MRCGWAEGAPSLSSPFFLPICTTPHRVFHRQPSRIVLSAFAVDSWHEPIDKLYLAILNQHAPMHDLERFKRRMGLLCLPALHGTVNTSTYDEINVEKQASIIFQESLQDLQDSLVDCQSLFSLEDSAEVEPIKLNHATFRDFIFSYQRSREFHVEEQALHVEVISRHLSHVFAVNFCK